MAKKLVLLYNCRHYLVITLILLVFGVFFLSLDFAYHFKYGSWVLNNVPLFLLYLFAVGFILAVIAISSSFVSENAAESLTLYDESFIITHKNRAVDNISLEDVEKVRFEIFYSKIPDISIDIICKGRSYKINTPLFRPAIEFLSYLKNKCVEINYSNNLARNDLENGLKRLERGNISGKICIILACIFWMIFCCLPWVLDL